MLTDRMMAHAIASRLNGIETDLPVEKFREPWREAYEVLDEMEGTRQNRIQALFPILDRERLGEMLALAETPLDFPSLAEIAHNYPRPEWLWPQWIPRGSITLLGGVQGAGKGYLALDLAHRIISGQDFPDGSPVPRPGGPILYVDAENFPDLTNERAEVWGMDRSRLFLMLPDMVQERKLIDFTDRVSQDLLIDMMHFLHPELVIIDSLSCISSRGENAVEEVRELLGFLNAVAQSQGCGLLLFHHLRKRHPKRRFALVTQDDFRGSSHILAAARSALGLSIVQTGPQPNPNAPRHLAAVKLNRGQFPEPIGFEPHSIPEYPDVAMISYCDPPQPYREPRKVDFCADWLLEMLREAEGPLKPKDIIARGEEFGFGRSVIYEARALLAHRGVIGNTVGRRSTSNEWILTEHVSENEPPAADTVVGQCVEWLTETLSDTPMSPKQVITLADDQGFSESTVYRARRKLGDRVVDTHGQTNPKNRWRLKP